MSYQTGILPALRDWGLTVIEVPGWKTCGSSNFNPHGHVFHHDVIPDQPGDDDKIPSIIVKGRPDLPGPLANFWLERDGNVHLCAAGRANHAGEGGWHGLSGNSSVWGCEMNNLGTPDDEWPEVQLDAAYRLAAATMDYSGFPVANVCFHKEWAPGRKIDPHTLIGDAFRTAVQLQEKKPAVPEEDDMTIIRWPDGPSPSPPLVVSGAMVITCPPSQLDFYKKAGVPVVTLSGPDAKDHYKQYEKKKS